MTKAQSLRSLILVIPRTLFMLFKRVEQILEEWWQCSKKCVGVVRILTCWDQVEEIFWFTLCFNSKKCAELPELSSKFQRLKSQFSLRCSFYCTRFFLLLFFVYFFFVKGSILLYMFNFGTKAFIIRLVIDDVLWKICK